MKQLLKYWDWFDTMVLIAGVAAFTQIIISIVYHD